MNRIFVTGDIHGDVKNIRSVINQIENPRETDKIIVCGDAGLEYGYYIMHSAKKAMKKFPGSWIIMRGNHDTRYWRDHQHNNIEWEVKDNYLFEKKYPNILYIKDEGGLYNIEGINFLFIPGAYSVDKEYRIQQYLPYESEEQLTTRELFNLKQIIVQNKHNIDFVIGHTFPITIQPYYQHLFLDFINQEKVDKNMEESIAYLMEPLENEPNFKQYFGGHFHADMILTPKYTMLYHDVLEIGDYLGCR